MILVLLGTQDKQFPRLLDSVEDCIKRGIIKERVVVQAGLTNYESEYMEIFDLLPAPEYEKLMDEADLIITHGGAGSILDAIKKGKKVIAAARLSKYREHHNDHQKQIIGEFASLGYLLELKDFNKLDKLIKKIKTFNPKKFVSNTNNMIKLIENYIEDSNSVSWFNKFHEQISYLFFGGCTTIINIISFAILFQILNISTYVSNAFAWVIAVLFAFITNKYFVFESREKNEIKTIMEALSFFGLRLLSLAFDMGFMYLMIDILNIGEIFSKVVSNIFVIIINYLFSKLFIFRK